MKNFYEKIEAYLRGKLDAKEKALFEKEISENPELKKAAILHSLGMTQSPTAGDPVRETLAKVRKQAGSLSRPQMAWKDQSRFFFLDRARVARAAAVIVFLLAIPAALFLYPLPNNNLLIEKHTLIPDCGDVAGETPDTRNLKQEAAYVYCGIIQGGLDTLLQLAGTGESFNIANFYLANFYLKNKNYEAALSEFDKCLLHQSVLNEYDSGYVQLVRFNRLLAILGSSGSSEQLLSELEQFLEEYPGNQKAQSLHKELNHPIRKIRGN